MLKLRRPRALALLLLVSMITTSCTAIDRYGSSSGNVTTSETLDDDTDLEWGGECEDVDLDDTDVLEGDLDPCECEYVSAELTCADDEKIQALRDRAAKLQAAAEKRRERAKAAQQAVKELLTAADIKAEMMGKLAVVVVNGDRRQRIAGVPNPVRDAFRQKFSAANKAANGGWVFDDDQSNVMVGPQFFTREELDRVVDATEKGAGGLFGIEAYKVEGGRYAVVQGHSLVLFAYYEPAANPRNHTGSPINVIVWPDDFAPDNFIMKWFKDHRWSAYMPKVQAIVGTDPAKSREEMIQAAIKRAVEDLERGESLFTAENFYELIKVLPVTGTIDALERGDCPDAIASALTDLATLVGFFPAKVFRLGKLKVPGVVLMMALDGGAIAIRIAYKKDGAWAEAVITAALQARALKKALTMLLKNQRARAALAGTTLAALSLACDKAEKAVDDLITAEDEMLKARDELDKARLAAEGSIKIPCDGDDEESDDDTVLYDDVSTGDVCTAAAFDGTFASYVATYPELTVEGAVATQPIGDDVAIEVRDAVSRLGVVVETAPFSTQLACSTATIEPTPVEPTPIEPTAEPTPIEPTPTTDPYTVFRLGSAVSTTLESDTTTMPLADPPVVCVAPPPHPAVSGLVDRFKKITEDLDKVHRVINARRVEAEKALITTTTLTLAKLYGVGTDVIEREVQDWINQLSRDKDGKVYPSWNTDVDRYARVIHLVGVLGKRARQGDPLNNVAISAPADERAKHIAKLEEYEKSMLDMARTTGENIWWQTKNNVYALAWITRALPKLEEYAKSCTPITPKMFEELGMWSLGTVTMTPQDWAEYLTRIETEMTTLEAKVAKATRIIVENLKE